MKIIKESFPKKAVRKKQQPDQSPVADDAEALLHKPANNHEVDPIALLFASVDDLTEEFKSLFIDAAEKKYIREGLVITVRSKLTNYQQLQGTAFQVAVNNHVMHQSLDE